MLASSSRKCSVDRHLRDVAEKAYQRANRAHLRMHTDHRFDVFEMLFATERFPRLVILRQRLEKLIRLSTSCLCSRMALIAKASISGTGSPRVSPINGRSSHVSDTAEAFKFIGDPTPEYSLRCAPANVNL